MQYWLRSRNTSYVLLLSFVCSILFFPSCDPSSHSDDGTVIIGIRADFDSLNELNAADTDALQVIQHMLFMPLTKLNKDLAFAPYLAKRWEFSESNRVLTFYLRDDVYWTDGQKTTAADVLFTYNAAINPDVAYPAASRFDLIDRLEMLDDYIVQVHLKKAYPDILFDMQIPILPKHILGILSPDEMLTSSFNRKPIGNGPFKLSEWKANQTLIFEANKNFALGAPTLNRVVFSIIPDENILLTNLLSGTIDVMPRLTPENAARIETSDITIESFPGKIFTFVGWNLQNPILSQPVRRAFSHAIDKDEIIQTLLEGYGKPAIGPLTPMAWAFDKNVNDIDHNIDRAKTILKEQGWRDTNGDGILDKNGAPLNISLKVNSGSRLRQDVAILVQAQLTKIGVRVEIDRVEWNLFIEQVFQKGEFDAVILAWDTDFTVNPAPLWHSNAINDGYNFVSYDNPRVDELLALGRNTTSREAAQPFWSEFQQLIIDDCPYTFLFIQDNIVAYNKRLHGCEFDQRSLYVNIAEWSVK